MKYKLNMFKAHLHIVNEMSKIRYVKKICWHQQNSKKTAIKIKIQVMASVSIKLSELRDSTFLVSTDH